MGGRFVWLQCEAAYTFKLYTELDNLHLAMSNVHDFYVGVLPTADNLR